MWWPDVGSRSPAELAREAGFGRAVDLWGDGPADIGDKRLSTLQANPRTPSSPRRRTRIAWLGCGGDPPLGIFTPPGLAERKPERNLGEERVHAAALDELREANALVLRRRVAIWPVSRGRSPSSSSRCSRPATFGLGEALEHERVGSSAKTSICVKPKQTRGVNHRGHGGHRVRTGSGRVRIRSPETLPSVSVSSVSSVVKNPRITPFLNRLVL